MSSLVLFKKQNGNKRKQKENKNYNVRASFTLQRREVGSNEYCSVPQCTANSRYSSELSFHCFPKVKNIRAQWIQKIRRTGFSVTKHTKVCSRHFQRHEILTGPKGRRVLAAGAVPSLFAWNDYKIESRPSVWERRARPAVNIDPEPIEEQENAEVEEELMPVLVDHDYVANRFIVVDRDHYVGMQKEIEELRQQVQSLQLKTFGLQRFAGSDDDIRYYTR